MTACHAWDTGLGAWFVPGADTRFRLWAPSVERVALEVAGAAPVPMCREDEGFFSAALPAPAGTRYRFVLPDGMAVSDPASRAQNGDVHGWSVVVDPSAYGWKNTIWQGRPWHEAAVYELHPGAAGGFAGVQADLDRLRSLGVTFIEIMPVADFPGRHNWGYDGVLPYAPDEAYGTPEALKELVDAAHGRGLAVILDVVYNHFGPEGNYLHAYAGCFFRDDVQTPWGAAIDFRQRPVREFFIQNALMWLMEYRFDGLRFDAVHAIESTDFLEELATRIRETVDPGRHIALVLEHEGNRASLLERHYDAQWGDDWHHCVHVLLTSEKEGYYEDFQDAARLLARCLKEGFAYQGEVSPHAGTPRGESSAHLPATAFVFCLQNHDQIGNRAFGDRLAKLADPDALRAAMALLLLGPEIPMLFMGEEWATQAPFLFFTDHHAELARLVREGRRNEFRRFAAFADPELRARIPDPNDPLTFEASIPRREETAVPEHAEFLSMVQILLGLRQSDIAPRIPGCRSIDATPIGPGAVQASWRMGDGARLTIAANLARASTEISAPHVAPLFETRADAAATAREGRLPPQTTIAWLEPS
jgi:maltooligosyltrehalose trehalohydrolase